MEKLASAFIRELAWQVCVVTEPASPIRGLATESVLFETLPPATGRLFLWRSVRSVVIGKNQIPWAECDPVAIARDGGIFARRQTGGGAVYHDPGNVCYSLMMPRDGYDADAVGEVVATALRPLGVALHLGPRHVLMAGDAKVSGTAFCYRRQRVLHHGTLLVDADLAALEGWLRPALPEVSGKAVASVRSRVINLRELQPTLTPTAVLNALATACGPAPSVTPAAAAVEAEYQRFAADAWRFGMTPAFELATAAGTIHFRKGLVESAPDSELVGKPCQDVCASLS